MYNIAAVIPIHGRRELLIYTLNRLIHINKLKYVICIGDSPKERYAVVTNGGVFVKHPNTPLGRKWNAGFEYASKLDIDGVLYMGSDDMISSNYMEKVIPLMKSYDLVGIQDYSVFSISLEHGIQRFDWDGYENFREGESVGAGRLISSRILDKIGWRPFDDNANRGMDYYSRNRMIQFGARRMSLNSSELGVSVIGVSCDKWANLSGKSTYKESDDYQLLDEYPEVLSFYNQMYGKIKPIRYANHLTILP